MGDRAGQDREAGRKSPRVLRLALEFLAFCQRHGRTLKRSRPSLNDQLQTEADSILLNLGESFDETSIGDKRRFLRYALRSAGEAEKALHALATLRLLPPPALTEGFRLIRDIRFDLKRLTRHT